MAMLKFLRAKMEDGNENFEGILGDKVMEDIIENQTRYVVLNMLDCEKVVGESNIAIVKVLPMVEYDKYQIFKATLVSQLNANPFLSKG